MKKTIALLLAGLILSVFCACGKSSGVKIDELNGLLASDESFTKEESDGEIVYKNYKDYGSSTTKTIKCFADKNDTVSNVKIVYAGLDPNRYVKDSSGIEEIYKNVQNNNYGSMNFFEITEASIIGDYLSFLEIFTPKDQLLGTTDDMANNIASLFEGKTVKMGEWNVSFASYSESLIITAAIDNNN